MSLESGLYSFLTGNAAISALIGDRVYPAGEGLPQGVTYPAIAFQVISDLQVDSLTGVSCLRNPRVQLDHYADTYLELVTLSDTVRKQMNGHMGPFGTENISARYLTQRDLYEPGVEKPRRSQDYSFWYTEG